MLFFSYIYSVIWLIWLINGLPTTKYGSKHWVISPFWPLFSGYSIGHCGYFAHVSEKKVIFPWIYQIFFVYLYSKLRFWLRIALRTIKEFAGEGLRETCYTSSVEKLGQFQPSALLRVYLIGDEMILRIYTTKKGLSNLSYK